MEEFWDVLDKDGVKTGRVQKRGWLESGNYHLCVFVWIINRNKEFLLSKRASNIRWPNKWATTAGSAITGDDSITTVLKEVKEELGITLDPSNGKIFLQYRNDCTEDCGEFIDVWIFQQEIDINSIVLQPEETCDAMWADRNTILKLIEKNEFVPIDEACPYLYNLLDKIYIHGFEFGRHDD